MTIVDLSPDDPRLADAFGVLVQLRAHLTPEGFAATYREGHPQGLRFTTSWAGDRCVAVAGWRIVTNTSTGRMLYVDDLVTDADSRSGGHGAALLADLTGRAAAAGCSLLTLDSGVQRHDAHRFYFRERMAIVAHHFALPLG